MVCDVKEIDHAIAKVRAELDVLRGVESTPIGGFVLATEDLSAIKEIPGNQLKLHPADLKGMHQFKTREKAEEIMRFWNDKIAEKGPEFEHMRVTVMTKKAHLMALIPHHQSLIETFGKVRQSLIDKESSSQT
jgi:hypothetical protein